MIAIAEKDLEQIQSSNYTNLKNTFESVQAKFNRALDMPKDSEDYRDMTIYRPEEIWKYD